MKRILITGANSYIGDSFVKYLERWPEEYRADVLDMQNETWETADFSAYDAVFHVAGIAHIKETAENAHLYYEVNRDLAAAVAEKAKAEGVNQFVFLSSMSVYGIEEGEITGQTPLTPKSNYGKSKLEAEEQLDALRDESFSIVVLRPPMVYGEGCKGNYQTLVKLAKLLPVFPAYENRRSMIHIDNLVSFVKNVMDSGADGLFLPQDEEYVCTSKMVQEIGRGMGKKICLLKILNPAVAVAKRCTTMGKKAFGDLVYVKEE